nr:NAD-binding protein [Thiocystis violacea]
MVSEHNDIHVVDTNPRRLRQLQSRFDLCAVVGNAAPPSVLREAGAEDAELFTNLCACRTDGIPSSTSRPRSPACAWLTGLSTRGR